MYKTSEKYFLVFLSCKLNRIVKYLRIKLLGNFLNVLERHNKFGFSAYQSFGIEIRMKAYSFISEIQSSLQEDLIF